MKPPILKVTWHHLREFVLGMPPMIWLEIENLGSSATLSIDGKMGGKSLGKASYTLPGNGYVELGFHWDQGPKIMDELIDQDQTVHYSVYLRLENEHGSDVYIETKKIPVKRYHG